MPFSKVVFAIALIGKLALATPLAPYENVKTLFCTGQGKLASRSVRAELSLQTRNLRQEDIFTYDGEVLGAGGVYDAHSGEYLEMIGKLVGTIAFNAHSKCASVTTYFGTAVAVQLYDSPEQSEPHRLYNLSLTSYDSHFSLAAGHLRVEHSPSVDGYPAFAPDDVLPVVCRIDP